jgi:hypothetical protein
MNKLYSYPLSASLRKLKDKELSKFKAYRDSYRFDLPKEILKPDDTDYELFICRVNIF